METGSGNVEKKLDRMIELIENLFILQATQAGIGVEQQRKVLGIAKEKVNQISREVRRGAGK